MTKNLPLGGLVAVLLWVACVPAAADDVRLVHAVKNGDAPAVLLSLLKAGADVNATEGDGATALAWASHRDNLEAAKLLIGAGANVNAGNEYGVTPLALGGIKGGRHLRYEADTPMANFYLTLVDKLGLPLEHFGDSTGKLDLLSV